MAFQKTTGLTQSMVNAVVTLGTTSTYTTTASTACVIDSKWAVVLTAQTNTATPTTDAATGAAFLPLNANKATVLVWGINAAGAIRIAQGTIVDTVVGVTTTVGAFINAPQFPALPEDFCPLAYSLHRTAPSAATWTPCTSSWTASGVYSGMNGTTTTQNVSTLPDRPQIA